MCFFASVPFYQVKPRLQHKLLGLLLIYNQTRCTTGAISPGQGLIRHNYLQVNQIVRHEKAALPEMHWFHCFHLLRFNSKSDFEVNFPVLIISSIVV